MLFLQYAVNTNGELIAIDAVGRGKTDLRCPYCGGLLIARKGETIAHHFAHADETCNPASRDMSGLSLPVYDNFNLNVPGRAVQELRTWDADPHATGIDKEYLERYGLLEESDYKPGWYALTKKGKLVLGQLSLDLFNQFQEPLILERHADIEARAVAAGSETDRQMYLTDLRLYRAQLRRVLACSLYFIQIGEDGLYKIGVTTRDIQERLREIAIDLRPTLGDVPLTVLGIWPARGNVEHYFKHRYRDNQRPIGTLTEYYRFEDVKPVLRDLRRMKAKQLSELEHDIVVGGRSRIELDWESQQIERRRVAGIKPGIERARQRGKQLGRPPGADTADTVLMKPYVEKVREALNAGLSLRDAARAAGVAINTVQRVKRVLDEQPVEATVTEKSLLTRGDLPESSLSKWWTSAIAKFNELWAGQRVWPWTYWDKTPVPERTDKKGAYYLLLGSQALYMGMTRREVVNNVLYVLNTGQDDPLKRLRLTIAEKQVLKVLDAKYWRESGKVTDDERGVYERLRLKGLVEVQAHRPGVYILTKTGSDVASLLK